jgi:hypothetical protein
MLLFHSVLLGFQSTMVAGMVLRNFFEYEVSGSFALNLVGPLVDVPAVIVSGPNAANLGPTTANIHDCNFIGWGGLPSARFPRGGSTPQIALGFQGPTDLVRSSRVVNNHFVCDLTVVPVYLDFGCSNSLVGLNASDGSGGVQAFDNGGGNAPNVDNLWT